MPLQHHNLKEAFNQGLFVNLLHMNVKKSYPYENDFKYIVTAEPQLII